MKFSSGQVNYFGRILQRLGVKSSRKTRGVYYHVVAVAQKRYRVIAKDLPEERLYDSGNESLSDI